MAFLKASVYQDRNAHNYLVDFRDEMEIYDDSGRLLQFLSQWQASSTPALAANGATFYHRVLQLSYEFANNGFWGAQDALLTRAWLIDLVQAGVKVCLAFTCGCGCESFPF